MNPRYMTIEEVEKELGYPVRIFKKKDIIFDQVPVGGVFSVLETEFIKMHHGFAVTKNIIDEAPFSTTTNNYKDSEIINSVRLNSFIAELTKSSRNIHQVLEKFNVSLTSDNGVSEYGEEIDTFVSLMTLDQLRQNSKFLLPYEVNAWWLVTPHGTVNTGVPNRVCYISRMGMLENAGIQERLGIRPVVKFKNNATVTYYDNMG